VSGTPSRVGRVARVPPIFGLVPLTRQITPATSAGGSLFLATYAETIPAVSVISSVFSMSLNTPAPLMPNRHLLWKFDFLNILNRYINKNEHHFTKARCVRLIIVIRFLSNVSIGFNVHCQFPINRKLSIFRAK
jgi:hypothetical protein